MARSNSSTRVLYHISYYNCLTCQVSILLTTEQKQREKTSLYTEMYLNELSDKENFIKPALTDLRKLMSIQNIFMYFIVSKS